MKRKKFNNKIKINLEKKWSNVSRECQNFFHNQYILIGDQILINLLIINWKKDLEKNYYQLNIMIELMTILLS